MKVTVLQSQYLQIALDLARRIASGELAEGCRIYGRSMMASEYSVSPETIRRALRLLADMNVIAVKPQSGAVVLSAENAKQYIKHFENNADTRMLYQKLRELMRQYNGLHQQITEVATALMKRPCLAAESIPNYEIQVPEQSPVLGQSIGALKFWQATGCTIVGIRRGDTMVLSPGPYAELQSGDVLILVGTPDAVQAAYHLLQEERDC